MSSTSTAKSVSSSDEQGFLATAKNGVLWFLGEAADYGNALLHDGVVHPLLGLARPISKRSKSCREFCEKMHDRTAYSSDSEQGYNDSRRVQEAAEEALEVLREYRIKLERDMGNSTNKAAEILVQKLSIPLTESMAGLTEALRAGLTEQMAELKAELLTQLANDSGEDNQ